MSARNPATPLPTRRPFVGSTAGFAAGSDTPRDYLERCLEAIATLEPKIGAFVNLNRDGAQAAADRSSARWKAGKPLSPIDGMPVGIKDIIETADMPTEMGSPIFAGWRSGRDAATVAALREAGAVVLGKTVTTEFASTEPRGTRNPWDLERTPGGSSSGSAAAVAVGMLPAGLGTQVIGSIVRPASFCGVYGFKPSVGAINRGGSLDGLSQSCHGALAATLADAWATLREISARAGGDPGYPGLAGPRACPEAKKPRRLALLEGPGWTAITDAARAALAATVARLKAAGVEILTRSDTPALAAVETALQDANAIARSINSWEFRWPLNLWRDNPGLSQAMRNRLVQAEAMSREDFAALLAERSRIRGVYASLGALCDGCVTLPATGAAPLGLGSTGNTICAVAGSLLGVPALSLPLLTVEDLPLGLQIMGFEQQDAAAVATAAWIDRLFAQA
ncbi:MAG TPA: amidase [Stellaceae bacterium]|nr:amidase [Stellaceae bacterium]